MSDRLDLQNAPRCARQTRACVPFLVAMLLAGIVLGGCSLGGDDRSGGAVTNSNGLGRQAGAPSPSRKAGAPASDSNTAGTDATGGLDAADPSSTRAEGTILHVLGSVQTVENYDASFVEVAPVVEGGTATIASLGCPNSICPARNIATWASGQLDVISVATLRAAIEGPDSLASQVIAIENEGINVVGFGDNLIDATTPVVVGGESNEVAVYAISLAPDTQSLATESTPGVAGPASLDVLRESVIRSLNDGLGVVVLVDWGNVESRAPTDEQVDGVSRIISAGADSIVGHGPNTLQRFDIVDQTAVAYSLGNASTSSPDPLHADTAVLRLEFGSPGTSCLLPATAGPNGPAVDDLNVADCS